MRSRNQHEWGWMGFDRAGNEYQYCDLCKKWKITQTDEYIPASKVPDILYHNTRDSFDDPDNLIIRRRR